VLFIVATSIVVGNVRSGEPVGPYALNIWFRQPQYSGCMGDFHDLSQFDCGSVDSRASDYGFAGNFAWVLLSGVPPEGTSGDVAGIGGLQFGIDFLATVELGPWALCTGGAQIPQDDEFGTWPAAGTGIAMTYEGGCQYPDNPEGFMKVGYFSAVTRESAGEVWFVEDPRIGDIIAADCEINIYGFCEEQLGRGETAFTGNPGYVACGALCAVPVRESTWGQLKSAFGR
jgi:hypothetical protein